MSKQPISTFLGIAAGVVLATNSHAADIFVPGDQPTIQAAIANAIAGDVVIVAQGEYFENINFFGKAITVRSTDPNDPGVVMHTIINGGGSGRVVTCTSGEGANTVLSGFVITGGGGSPNGGGMFNQGSSPTVTNCTFSGNTAPTALGFGGGMRNDATSSPTVTNCSFTANSANQGGGMWNDNTSSPTVTNCSFSGNTADFGGGMYNINSSNPTVTNCSFTANSANQGGGGMFNGGASSATVTNCTFGGNMASNGGGMYNIQSSTTVTNCTFSGNTTSSVGGGMFNILSSSTTVTNTGFCNNTPDQISGTYTDGGGNSLDYCPPPLPKPDSCPTDTNNDGVTNVLDLIDLLLQFGQACP